MLFAWLFSRGVIVHAGARLLSLPLCLTLFLLFKAVSLPPTMVIVIFHVFEASSFRKRPLSPLRFPRS